MQTALLLLLLAGLCATLEKAVPSPECAQYTVGDCRPDTVLETFRLDCRWDEPNCPNIYFVKYLQRWTGAVCCRVPDRLRGPLHRPRQPCQALQLVHIQGKYFHSDNLNKNMFYRISICADKKPELEVVAAATS